MSFEGMKSEVAQMPLEQQDQLAAFLVHLRHQRDAGLKEEIANRIEDKNPEKWVSLERLKEEWKD